MNKTVSKIWESIKSLCRAIGKFIVKVINGIIHFFKDVVNWFKTLHLKQKRDVPFVLPTDSPTFKAMLRDAPVKKVGIFQGVYNEEEDKITQHQILEADGLDEETKNTFEKNELVVFS